jgi:hypothetical protein
MRIWLAALAIGLPMGAAVADPPQTYHSLRAAIAARSDCKHVDLRNTTLFRCEKDETLWYFTTPRSPAHPGVMERYFEQTPKGGVIAEKVWAPDTAKPAFKRWRTSLPNPG